MPAKNKVDFKKELTQIIKRGIRSDRNCLKEDMCAQFADPNEWIQEYVVNAYNAHARHCWIYEVTFQHLFQ